MGLHSMSITDNFNLLESHLLSQKLNFWIAYGVIGENLSGQ